MPIYQCAVAAGTVSADARATLAKEITRLHTEATGAPASFVHVLFLELPPSARFTGGVEGSEATIINGTIRAGRSLETRQELIRAISRSWAHHTGQPEEHIVVGVQEIPASAIVEGGRVLPEPGEEDAWLNS